MTYWWNEIGDRIFFFIWGNLCPRCLFFPPKVWKKKTKALGRSYLLALLFFSIGFRDF